MATPTNIAIDQQLVDNTTAKITPTLLRTVLHQLANLGANERVGGLKSVVYLTKAEAVAAGRSTVATLDQLDPLTCSTGTLAYIDLPPAGTSKWRVLVYDDRPAGSAGQVLAYFDGSGTRNYSISPATGLASLKWVQQGSTDEATAQLRRYDAGIADWALDETMKIALGGADTFFSANIAGGPLPAPTVAGLSTANWKASLVSGTSAPPAPIVYFDAATRRLTASHPQYTAAQLEFCFPGQAYVEYSYYAQNGVQAGDMFHEANIFHFRVKATATTNAGAVAGNPQFAAKAPALDAYATLAYASQLVLDFALAPAQLLAASGDLLIASTAGRAQGRQLRLHLVNTSASAIALYFPGWAWRGTLPVSLGSNKQATLTLECAWGGNENEIIAGYAAQQ